ncbi:MAG TPA: translation initiation factor IF-2 [Anaerolineae bacterium]|nr:translation initiation factor IF-2 [Anaerolineae bacterium]
MVEELRSVEVPEFTTVRDLAEILGVSPIDVIKELMNNGIMATINQQIDFDTSAVVAAEMGFEAHLPVQQEEVVEEEEALPLMARLLADEKPEDLERRPPVVTLLGHVDHGKTSLLDVIRNTSVQEGEVGGITQHIGAYQVEHNDRKITFLDTPGHQAFTAMRARGAQGADIAVLVVAADDGVMPQTREAISHARAAHVPIVVALNKIDLDTANPEVVKQQLSEEGLVVEDWGGDVICVPVSARTQAGIDELLENLVLVSEVNEFRANPNRPAVGVVVEAEMDRMRGSTATILVQNGTLHVGDSFVVGEEYGHVRAMFDYRGQVVESASPSVPVRILGLNGVPKAGDRFEVVKDDRTGRQIAIGRQQKREQAVAPTPEVTLESLFEQYEAGESRELNVILKADVQGSIEPIVRSIEDLSTDQIRVEVLYAGTGNISESDIMLAIASRAVVIGFNVTADTAARRQIESEGIEIRLYNIIYKIIDDMERALRGMLAPEYREVVRGHAEVRQVFDISRVGQVAGCYVQDGVIERNVQARVLRGEEVVFDGDVESLKRFQEDVSEVRRGFECGIGLDRFAGFQEGDIIEVYRQERVN